MVEPIIPTTEKVTETKETVKAVGETAPPLIPPAAADDNARKVIAGAIILQFLGVVGFMIWNQHKVDDTQMILGAEITFMSAVIQYYFGSSSGSTAKDKKPNA